MWGGWRRETGSTEIDRELWKLCQSDKCSINKIDLIAAMCSHLKRIKTISECSPFLWQWRHIRSSALSSVCACVCVCVGHKSYYEYSERWEWEKRKVENRKIMCQAKQRALHMFSEFCLFVFNDNRLTTCNTNTACTTTTTTTTTTITTLLIT